MDIGTRLRHAREARGLSIDAVSRSIRVQPRILSAVEQNDVGALPPRPYGRGFVRAYAAEVGLDPDSTMREFFSQFAPPVETAPATASGTHRDSPYEAELRHPWPRPAGALVTYFAVGALIALIGWSVMDRSADATLAARTSTRAGGPSTGAVGTTGSAAPVARAAEPEAVATPKPSAPIKGLTISLEAAGPAWVSATVDGRRAIYRTLQPGEQVTLKADQEIGIRAGDAGALKWRVNGRPAVTMGQPGEVRTVRITPETAIQVK